ncbi:carboxymuconolactone decarboxylase family domain protein [Burkholderia pseudomallei MSHR3965]|nr:carboxymuconolactone decarboxylase family domain protein [Burkholderia pseudomallei MSHR3965]
MALPQSYRELTGEVATQMRALRKTQPDLMSAFAALAAAGTKEGALVTCPLQTGPAGV